MPPLETLRRIDASCRAVAAMTADVEVCGGMLLHRPRHGWTLAARPRGSGHEVVADDVESVVARQRQIGLPIRLAWVDEVTPGLRGTATELGLAVEEQPLLVLDAPAAIGRPDSVAIGMVAPDDPGFADGRAAVDAGFRGSDDLLPERAFASIVERTRAGALRVCVAHDSVGAVGGGTSSGADRSVVELTGIAVLPRVRRRGIGAAITSVLAADALDRGADLIWLSATDEAVARVYERVGFDRVGTVCTAAAC